MNTDSKVVKLPESFDLHNAPVGVLPEEFDRATIENFARENRSVKVTFFAGFFPNPGANELATDYDWRGYDDTQIVLRRKVSGYGRWIVRTLRDIQVGEIAEDGSWSFLAVHKDGWVHSHENGWHTLSRVYTQVTTYKIRIPEEGAATYEVVSQDTTSFVD